MNKNISRVIIIVVFIFLIATFDQVIGSILRNLYFHQKTSQDHALTFSMRECKADILLFGASQCQHNYDSRIISDSLKMSCYNAGRDGGHSILLQYAQIKVITERYTPKIIILEFYPERIVHYTGDYDRLSVLLPYYEEYPELRHLIQLRSPYERVKLLSAIYPFNSNIINIIWFSTFTDATHKKDFDGYIPIKNKVMNMGMLKTDPEIVTQAIVDTNMVNALENIIQICKDKNITLFIVSSPVFHAVNEKQNPPTSAAKLSLEIILQNKVNYLDFSFDSTFAGHLDWFADKGHLNYEGAKVFTNKLTEILKNYKYTIDSK